MRNRSALAAVLLAAAPLLAAQAPAFEVASIKPNAGGTGGTNLATYHGRFTAQNVGARTLVYLSHGVQEFQVEGGPRWIVNDRFDIDAKAATAVDDPTVMLMLRSLLTDRFGLTLHREMRELPAHVLVVGSKGPRLPPVATEVSKKGFRFVILGINEDKSQRMRLSGTGSLAELASALARAMRMPVVDETGVTGVFDLNVEWNSDSFGIRIKGSERGALTGAPLDFPAVDPELNATLQRQLGLKFETRKAQVEILVIDRAERPSEN